MKKLMILLIAILLPAVFYSVSATRELPDLTGELPELAGGLPNLTDAIPDPAVILGNAGTVFAVDYLYNDAEYFTMIYSRPDSEEDFIAAYTKICENAGYTVTRTLIEGYGCLKISASSYLHEALLLYDYQDYMLLMVPSDMDFLAGNGGTDGDPDNENRDNAAAEDFYQKGERAFLEEDYAAAVPYLRQAVSLGHTDAMLLLGYICTVDNSYIGADGKDGSFYIGKASEAGNANALLIEPRVCFDSGKFSDYEVFLNYAIEHFKTAVDRGSMLAAIGLGDIYENGDAGVERSYETAAEYYRIAADLNDIPPVNPGILQVMNYYYGSAEIYKNYLEYGPAEAQTRLGKLYESGFGVPRSEEIALYYYKTAAEREFPEALFCMGQCRFFGIGTEQDYEEAVKWYLKAAAKGHPEAHYKLYECYLYGYGVPADPDEAERWYTIAFEHGYSGRDPAVTE